LWQYIVFVFGVCGAMGVDGVGAFDMLEDVACSLGGGSDCGCGCGLGFGFFVSLLVVVTATRLAISSAVSCTTSPALSAAS